MLVPRTQDLAGDPFGLLLRQRIIFLGGEVNDFSADAIISQLLLLDTQAPNKDIKLFINSPGGSVTAGMGIYDAMQMSRCDIQTFCFGLAASMGAFLLGAGVKGKRQSMPNARIMIHQPLGGASGQAVDVEIQAREILHHKDNINKIMSDYTGQTYEQLVEDTDRDRYMSPVEALDYGLIDEVIGGREACLKLEPNRYLLPKSKAEYVAWGSVVEEEMEGVAAGNWSQIDVPKGKPFERTVSTHLTAYRKRVREGLEREARIKAEDKKKQLEEREVRFAKEEREEAEDIASKAARDKINQALYDENKAAGIFDEEDAREKKWAEKQAAKEEAAAKKPKKPRWSTTIIKKDESKAEAASATEEAPKTEESADAGKEEELSWAGETPAKEETKEETKEEAKPEESEEAGSSEPRWAGESPKDDTK